MKKSLLSHIASNFISEYENVANSSISYLLNNYASVRETLKKILDIADIPTNYITELSTKDNGRPDVTGRDGDGNKIVIIEGKFWANLTDNQPTNYLKELKNNGRLLFLVPDKRKKSLEIDIENRIGKKDNRIAIFSWNEFLKRIELENNKPYDGQLSSDLKQLKELCGKIDEEGLAPLSQSDLDPMHGRLIYNFSNIIDECNSRIRDWEKSVFKGFKTAADKEGYGFYFKAFNFGCWLGFSNYDWFSKDSHTPFWLYLKDKDWEKSEKIYHFLNKFDPKNSYNEDWSLYGIVLKTGMDKSQIIEHIVNKIKEVLEFLDTHIKK